jgi:hypothetical protein
MRMRVAAVRPSDWAASAGAGTKCVHKEVAGGCNAGARELAFGSWWLKKG